MSRPAEPGVWGRPVEPGVSGPPWLLGVMARSAAGLATLLPEGRRSGGMPAAICPPPGLPAAPACAWLYEGDIPPTGRVDMAGIPGRVIIICLT